MIFRLKKAGAITRFAIFTSPPSWETLATRICEISNISVVDVLVAYVVNKETVGLSNDEDLQHFYKTYPLDEEIKFVVQDGENVDTINTITETWSAGSNLFDEGKFRLGCLDLSSPNPLLIEVGKHKTVSELKKIIAQEMKYEKPYNTLNLWKVSPPIPSQEIELRLLHAEIPKCIQGCVLLDSLDNLSTHFSSPPCSHVHIIVETPTAKRRALGDVIESPASKRRRIESCPPLLGNAAHRGSTVRALFQRLEEYRFVQVRGTPGSGKTTLAKLLAKHIQEEDSTRKVIWVSSWPEEEVRESGGFLQYLQQKGWDTTVKTVICLDEAQTSYWDERLWRDLFRDIDHYGDLCAIAFASYGSPTLRIDVGGNSTPIQFGIGQRVTLAAIDHKDGIPPAGLLFTREEVDDFIRVLIPGPDNYFHLSFFDALFTLTKGHVGAIKDFVQIIMAENSYRSLKISNQLYFWKTFLRSVGPRNLLTQLGCASIFGRGLPKDADFRDPFIAKVFSTVLCNGHVTNETFTTDSDEHEKLLFCFRNGFLHSDRTGRADDVAYFFPSPLHRWFVEWKLWDSLPAVQIEIGDILSLVINVISKFSPRQLATKRQIASGGIQRPPEAQFQDEFYRSCHTFSKGSIVSFPEYGTANGRVDFYIPAKEWGIELLRDGNKLAEHSGRFSKNSSYATDLDCSDYIILDFRMTRPRLPHPDLQKLYHIVFSDDFLNVLILDNKLVQVDGGEIRLLASS